MNNKNGADDLSQKKPAPSGLLIDVPFAQKDEAKALGARWNPEAKKWFIPDGVDKEKFSKWIK